MDIQLIIIIAIFAIVQSIFGMGILVFGTPTLLLLGFSFSEVLSILLPPSLTISAIQFTKQKYFNQHFMVALLKYCLPFMIFAMVWTLVIGEKVNFYLFVASILILSSSSRMFPKIADKLQLFIENNTRGYLILMGCVHGLSNMGGSLLSTYAVSQHKQKQAVLSCVVTGYILFGFVQLCTLSFLNELNLSYTTALNCMVAAVTYLLIGNRIFTSLNNNIYQHIFSILMLVYALLLIFS